MTTRHGLAAMLMALALAGCTSDGRQEPPVMGKAPSGTGAADTTGPSTPALVSGTVTYRERIALPPDAVVDLWITDIGPGMITQAILAEASVPAEGRQVPLPFAVTVDPSRVQTSRPYGLRAVIRAGGQTLFEKAEPLRVLTQGAPSTVTVMLRRPAS